LVPSLKSRNLGADIDLNVIPFGQFSGEIVNPLASLINRAGCCNAQNWCLRRAVYRCTKGRNMTA
jgi:hypothetical protein